MTGAWTRAKAVEAKEMDGSERCLRCHMGTTWSGFAGEAGDGWVSTKEDS